MSRLDDLNNLDHFDSIEDAFARHVAWTSDNPIGLVVDSAQGARIKLDDGRELIDLISGIAVSSIGHRHPAVIDAIREQIDRHLHVMVYGEFIQRPQVRFATLLTSHLPETLQVVYFTMSGTEANEGALKVSKKHTGRAKMVAFERSYHGDTHGSLSVTGRAAYRDPYEPLLPGVTFLPFNNTGALGAIDTETACVIVEPIQGEGGIRVADAAWFTALRQRCTEVGALLIFDEIQTGFGRTGSLFAFEQYGVVPDILTLAKAMGGGMPLGAFVASQKVMSCLRRDPPLSHVTTFGGHPVSCAAASAALEIIVREGLSERAVTLGNNIRHRLSHRRVEDIRGRGTMLGLELGSSEETRAFVQHCLEHGVLLGWTLHSDTLVRIAPPLNIPLEDLSGALDVMVSALDIL